MNSWSLAAVMETISVAEEAIDMGETIALMNPKTYKGKTMPDLDLDITSPPAATAEKTPAPTQRVTRSKSKQGPVPPDSTSEEVTSSQKTPVVTQREAPVRTSGKTAATPQPQQHTPPPLTRAARRRSTRMHEDMQNWRVREEYFNKDDASQHSDTKFLRALKSEYVREGTLRNLRNTVKAAPHQSLQDFKLMMLAPGSPLAQSVSQFDLEEPIQTDC
ncbi:hypothetical protein CYMTET_20685 [Cymbomonas tetramitiformis]|uniref:Uncharacterized protein n=1 Tax=Cymbomonas tetramitiformis TaxID=36881 RepID=A0AAE0G3J8_9CHLO|nr:hypothetical protein CYMTET_20685 [Cymbomonas tetramitiformis]